MDRLFYLAYLTSFTGILLLSFLSPTLEPPLSDLSSVGVFSIGKSVRVSGAVQDIRVYKGGGVSFSLSSGDSEIKVYVPGSVGIVVGGRLRDNDNAELIGVVSQYRGEVELVVSSAEDVRLK